MIKIINNQMDVSIIYRISNLIILRVLILCHFILFIYFSVNSYVGIIIRMT